MYNKVGPFHALGIIDEEHLSMMQKYFINSLKNQTDQDFTIQLSVGPEECEATKRIKSLDWGDLNVNFLHTSGDLTQWESSVIKSKNWAKETDGGSPEQITKSLIYPRTPIMARIDIDDWVAPGWVAHMKYMASTMKENRFLINYQVFGQSPDGRVYKFYAPHSKSRTSPFISIIQKEEITTDIYNTVHLRMGDLFDTVYTIPPSYAYMVVHGGNRSNQVYELDKFEYVRETDETVDNQLVIKQEPLRINVKPPQSWREKISVNANQSV